MIYHAQGEFKYADKLVFGALDILRKGSRRNLRAPNTMIDWRPLVHEMRLFKSEAEIAVMRKAGEISALAHIRAMKTCKPGMYEYQLCGELDTNSLAMGHATPRITRSLAAAKCLHSALH